MIENLNNSIVRYNEKIGFVIKKNKNSSVVFDFLSSEKIEIENLELKSIFHFNYNIFNTINKEYLCYFSKDFYNNFEYLIEDLKYVFNLQDRLSTKEIIEKIEKIENRKKSITECVHVCECYTLFVKYMRNTLFLMNKFSEIDEEPLSAKEIKNIKKHTE